MITVKNKTTIASISELRNKSEEILNNVKDHHVILERHSKPVAIMIDFKQYEALEKMFDFAEDYVLGMIASERDKKTSAKDYIDIEKW